MKGLGEMRTLISPNLIFLKKCVIIYLGLEGRDVMAHIVHCRICKTSIDVDSQKDWIQPSPKWYYHISCYNDFAKKRGAIKEKDLTIEADDDLWRGATFDYLQKDLKMSVNYSKFLNQWNAFLKKDMTAKGIYFTLRYFYEVCKGNIAKSENGIGIVPYIYTEGTNYWGERNQRDKGICARIEEQIMQIKQQPTVVIKQKRPDRTFLREEIDLASIAAEDNE